MPYLMLKSCFRVTQVSITFKRISMKKIYLSLFMFLVGFGSFKAQAGHVQGAEIGYTSIAPNVYQVRLKVYRDCMAISLPTTLPINLKADGCNTGRSVTVNRVGNPR